MLQEKQWVDPENDFDQPDSIPFIDFFKIYVNFGYFILLVPFRLVRNIQSRKLEIRSNKTQKMFCGIIQLAILFQSVSVVWWSSRQISSSNHITYFTVFSSVSFIAYHVSVNFTFWMKQDAFCLIFDKMQRLKFYDQKKEKTTVFWINMISIGTSITALVMGMTDIYLINTLYKHHSLIKFYGDLKERAQIFFLFMESSSSERKSIFVELMVSLLTLLQIMILIPSVVLVPYVDFFVLLVPICVRRIMREFRQFCKNSMGSPVASERILNKYATLRKFFKNCNGAMGILICTCVCVSLPYYAAWIGVSFFENNAHPVMLIRVYAFFLIFFLALSLAADINKKGIEFYCWVSSLEHSEDISTKTISSLLMDLHSNQMALRGSAFFVITYRFLGTIFGVIVTYSIITIQLQITRRANSFCNNTMQVTL